jgi:hypothetical protein
MPGPGEWTTYQFPDAGFTVRLPAAPTHTSTAETAPFAAETMYHEVLAEGEDWLFSSACGSIARGHERCSIGMSTTTPWWPRSLRRLTF